MAYNDWLQRSSEMFSWLFALFHRPRKHARCPCLYAFRIWDFLLFLFSLINICCFFCSFCLLYQINHCTIFMFSSFLCFAECIISRIIKTKVHKLPSQVPVREWRMVCVHFKLWKLLFIFFSFSSLHWMKEEKLCHFR